MKVWRSILALVLLSAACTTEPARRAAEAAPSHRLELALSYAPGDSPTEQRIEKLQEQLRKEVSLEKSLMLAQLFMMRRRETSAPILMTYAQDAVDAVLAMAPNDHRGRLLSAMIHQYEHRFAKAEEIARAVIATHPEKPDAYHLLGDAQLEVGRYEQAIAAYQAAMDRRPDLRAYNRAAYMTWLHGDAQSAIRLLDAALDTGSQRDPGASAWCFVDLGEIYRHQGDVRRTIAAAEMALKLQPDYVPALTLRARAHALAGDHRAALADYARVLARLPTVETLLAAAELHDDLGQTEAAARRRRQATSLAESDPRPYAHDLARRNVRPQDAVRFAKLALERRQGIFAWDTYGLALIRAGRLAEAAEALRKARALNSPFAEHALHRALLASAQSRIEDARRDLAEARRINPLVDDRLVREVEAAVGRKLSLKTKDTEAL